MISTNRGLNLTSKNNRLDQHPMTFIKKMKFSDSNRNNTRNTQGALRTTNAKTTNRM